MIIRTLLNFRERLVESSTIAFKQAVDKHKFLIQGNGALDVFNALPAVFIQQRYRRSA
jgi:hypothetical protein